MPGSFPECLQAHLSHRGSWPSLFERLLACDQPPPFPLLYFPLRMAQHRPIQLPLSLHFLCLSLWLFTGSQGSSCPFSPSLSFSATQSFISGTIHWPLGRKQSGLRFWLRKGRPGQKPQWQRHRPVFSFAPSIHTLASTEF